jgi:hypothetical protein
MNSMNRAKSLLFSSLAAGLLLAPGVSAHATIPTEDMQAKYEKKLSKEFVEYGGWITDYDVARATAKKEGKVLFVYFSRSYAP